MSTDRAESRAEERTGEQSERSPERGEGKRVEGPTRRSASERARGAFSLAGKATTELRKQLGRIVWLVAVGAAVVLGLGALLIALGANRDNSLVDFVVDLGNKIDGPFDNVFTFDDRNRDDAMQKKVLVNHGLAALAYLIVGKAAEKIIRP